MEIFKRITLAFASVAAFALAVVFAGGCASDTTQHPDTPREFFGVMEYTGPTYAVFYIKSPYKYAFRDLNGKFVAYIDTRHVVSRDFGSLVGNPVFIKGVLKKIEGESVIIADKIRSSRL